MSGFMFKGHYESHELFPTKIKDNYRPRSEASEGYAFTGVCHSVTGGGVYQGPGHNIPLPRDLVTTPSSPTPETWSQHTPFPHLGPGHNTPSPRDYAQADGTHPTGMYSCW